MSKRLRSVCLVAAAAATTVTAVTLTVTISGGTAAASDATCKPVANIFTTQADGDLWLYKHGDPLGGGGSWAGAQQIGWGWGGKTFAGPNGRLYNITTGGELRRLRYNGSSWDTFPNGGQYEAIGWGWQRYLTERTKITVDADGSIYTLEGDQLRWWHYNDAGGWAPDSGRVLDIGWNRFDQVTASGPGGLQARDSSGTLHRFRYHRDTERFVAYDVIPGTKWRGYDKLFSAGGDVYYAVRPDNGQLLWNRFSEEMWGSNWRTDSGNIVGYDWGTDVDITATTNDCTATNLIMPRPAAVGHDSSIPPQIVTPASGGTNLLYTTYPEGDVLDRHSTSSGWATRPVGGKHPAISSPVSDDTSTVIGATEFETGDVKLYTLRDGQWQTPLSLKGAMEHTPALVRRSNGTLAVYAMGDKSHAAYGQTSKGFVREQLPNGDFLAWRTFTDPTKNYFGQPQVVHRGAETTIVLSTDNSRKDWFRHTAGGVPVRKGTLSPNSGPVVLTRDHRGDFLVFGYYYTGEKNVVGVLHEKADRSGFEENWEPVGGDVPDGVHGAPIDAQFLPNGAVAVTVISNAHQVYVTTSTSVDSREFHPWRKVTPDGYGHSFSYSPTLTVTRAGELALAVRSNDVGYVHHLWTAPIPVEIAQPPQFTGGKIG